MTGSNIMDRRLILSRGLALIGCAMAPSGVWAAPGQPPPSGDLTFRAYRQGVVLGEHRLTFSHRDGTVEVATQVDFAVRLGPIALFRYSHGALEVWRDGHFERLQTATVTNGKKQSVQARRAPSGVQVEPAQGAPYLAEASALPLTHWNRQAMDAPCSIRRTASAFASGPSRAVQIRSNWPTAARSAPRAIPWQGRRKSRTGTTRPAYGPPCAAGSRTDRF